MKHVHLEPTICGGLAHCHYAIGDRLGKGQAVDPKNLKSDCGRSYHSNCMRNFFLWIFGTFLIVYIILEKTGYFKSYKEKGKHEK